MDSLQAASRASSRLFRVLVLLVLMVVCLGGDQMAVAQDQDASLSTAQTSAAAEIDTGVKTRPTQTTEADEVVVDEVGMAAWEAVILGIVEGLTEYLPVSSTGHLLVTQEVLGIGTESDRAREASYAYAICIQAGAILAVLGLYWARVKQGFIGLFGKVGIGQGNDDGWRMTVNLIVAFMPAAVIGLLADDWIEEKLASVWAIVAAWFVGGVAILVVSKRKAKTKTLKDDVLAQGDGVGVGVGDGVGDGGGGGGGQAKASLQGLVLEKMTWKMALIVGLIQCIAMWPGTSRSLVTIVGGVLVGLSLAAAVEFSFLLGVITLCAATVYKAQEAGPVMLEAYGWGPMLIGSFAAWLSAVIAVKWMVAYLKKHGMQVFGYYRIGIALVVGGAIVLGWLKV